MPDRDLPKIAVMTAAFFVVSLVHVPFGLTSVHLLLPGLVGVVLGPAAFAAIGLGLLLQSLLFQFGGLTALGGNVLVMGLPALGCGLLFQKFKGRSFAASVSWGVACGGLGIAGAALLLALLLAASGEDFLGVAKLAIVAHLPIMLIEAAMTGFVVAFLARVKPTMLDAPFAEVKADA
jgi:cobalt/nickel transport system permease protein